MAEEMTLVDHDQTSQLLHNKFVVVLGDSIHRGIYKDLVLLIQRDKYLSANQLRTKGELCFEGDCLVEGGNLGKMHNGTNYREVRQFRADHHLVRFYFITRIFSRYMESILDEFRHGLKPDVVIINSCVWDISRYSHKWNTDYKEDLHRLLGSLKEILPKETLVIWNLALPLGEYIKGGFLVPEIEHKASNLCRDLIEGNFYSLTLAKEYGMDVLDLHYHFRHLLQHRTHDEVHWDTVAHRRITSLLILHIAEAWNVEVKPSQVNTGQVQVGVRKPTKVVRKCSEGRQVYYDGYRPEFVSDSLPRGYLNFEYPAPRGHFHQPSPMYRCPLPPPPHPSLFQRHPYIDSSDHKWERDHYLHQPYKNHSHLAAMRRNYTRPHYAPYYHHHDTRYHHY